MLAAVLRGALKSAWFSKFGITSRHVEPRSHGGGKTLCTLPCCGSTCFDAFRVPEEGATHR